MDPLLTLALIVPLFAALGAALQWLLDRFEVSPLNSLLRVCIWVFLSHLVFLFF